MIKTVKKAHEYEEKDSYTENENGKTVKTHMNMKKQIQSLGFWETKNLRKYLDFLPERNTEQRWI